MKIMANDLPEKVGETVLTVLNASKEGVPLPLDLKRISNELLQFVGFKSQKAFAKSASHCCVALVGSQIEIMPYRSDDKGNYFPEADRKFLCSIEANAIGNSLRTAFGIND
jgi:hypothetical protein